MKNRFKYLPLILLLVGYSCKTEDKKAARNENEIEIINPKEEVITTEDSILNLALTAHGSKFLRTNRYTFDFRDKNYKISENKEGYEYQVNVKTDSTDYIDNLKNGNFTRISNGTQVELSEKELANSSSSLNSVVYFVMLPDKLNDKAVIKKYVGQDSIKGANYLILEITFEQEGGGEDFDDEFYYWINSKTHEIDYLAYNYSVNKGGVRFRTAYNKRIVNGVLFQDYINYKAKVGTPLIQLPSLLSVDSLIELSRIETENVVSSN